MTLLFADLFFVLPRFTRCNLNIKNKRKKRTKLKAKRRKFAEHCEIFMYWKKWRFIWVKSWMLGGWGEFMLLEVSRQGQKDCEGWKFYPMKMFEGCFGAWEISRVRKAVAVPNHVGFNCCGIMSLKAKERETSPEILVAPTLESRHSLSLYWRHPRTRPNENVKRVDLPRKTSAAFFRAHSTNSLGEKRAIN